MDFVPTGPRKVTAKNQVSIPDDLLKAIGVLEGESIWVMLNPDRPGTLVVMPREVMRAVIQKGWVAAS